MDQLTPGADKSVRLERWNTLQAWPLGLGWRRRKHISQDNPMTPEINKIVTWYSRQPRDFNDIHTLMAARQKLACLLAEMAGQLKDLYQQKCACEFQRKSAYARFISEEMSVEKMTAAGAKILADAKIEEYLDREYQSEAEYKGSWLLYDAYMNVCDTMNQHISNLKQERSRDMSGQSSAN